MGSSYDVVSTGWAFPECPRWHEGRLWFSDIYAGQVVRLDVDSGSAELVADYDGHPGGLGFLPDGRLLIADGETRRVLRLEADGSLAEHADLSSIATHTLNDMHVDGHGRAYVGNYGDASVPPEPAFPADLALVHPDGTAESVATDMLFANGMGMTADGSVLIVAETRAVPGRLSAFDVVPDGHLSGRRVFAELDTMPDGIAVDHDNGVWVASPFTDELLHLDPAGTLVARISVPTPYAVAVGSPGTVFACSSPTWVPADALAAREGAILRLSV